MKTTNCVHSKFLPDCDVEPLAVRRSGSLWWKYDSLADPESSKSRPESAFRICCSISPFLPRSRDLVRFPSQWLLLWGRPLRLSNVFEPYLKMFNCISQLNYARLKVLGIKDLTWLTILKQHFMVFNKTKIKLVITLNNLHLSNLLRNQRLVAGACFAYYGWIGLKLMWNQSDSRPNPSLISVRSAWPFEDTRPPFGILFAIPFAIYLVFLASDLVSEHLISSIFYSKSRIQNR